MTREPTDEEVTAYAKMTDDDKVSSFIIAACDAAYEQGKKDSFEKGIRVGKSLFNHWAWPILFAVSFTAGFMFCGALVAGLDILGRTQ